MQPTRLSCPSSQVVFRTICTRFRIVGGACGIDIIRTYYWLDFIALRLIPMLLLRRDLMDGAKTLVHVSQILACAEKLAEIDSDSDSD